MAAVLTAKHINHSEGHKRKLEAMDSSSKTCYQITNIHQWRNGWNGDDDNSSRNMLPLVDLRSYTDFNKQHLIHSNTPIVNLPLSTLLNGERSCELPPRHVEFAILIPRQYAQSFFEYSNTSIGDDDGKEKDCSIHQLFFASKSQATSQSRKPWLVRQVLVDSDVLWKGACEIDLVQCDDSKNRSNGENRTADMTPFQSLPRLWKPDPLISIAILPVLKEWITDRQSKCNNRLVFDLGSGAGRDICFLAEELKEFQHSLREDNSSTKLVHFVGIDNHKGSSKRCVPLWSNRGVADIAHSVLLDLNKLHLVRDFMDSSKLLSQSVEEGEVAENIMCLFAIRFLNRKLLSYVAESRSTDEPITNNNTSFNTIHSPPHPLVLPVGTIFAMSHFCKPNEGASWNYDHPKESSVLNRWELKNLFEHERWQIIKDDLTTDGDHGRTLIQFVVKKVA